MLTKKQLMRELNAYSRDYSLLTCPKGKSSWFCLIGDTLQSARIILRNRCSLNDLVHVCLLLHRVQELKSICGYHVKFYNYIHEEFE